MSLRPRIYWNISRVFKLEIRVSNCFLLRRYKSEGVNRRLFVRDQRLA